MSIAPRSIQASPASGSILIARSKSARAAARSRRFIKTLPRFTKVATRSCRSSPPFSIASPHARSDSSSARPCDTAFAQIDAEVSLITVVAAAAGPAMPSNATAPISAGVRFMRAPRPSLFPRHREPQQLLLGQVPAGLQHQRLLVVLIGGGLVVDALIRHGAV